MKKHVLAVVIACTLVSGCATTWRMTTKRCPTTTMVLADFVVGTAALVVSAIKYNAGKTGESLAYTAGAGAIFLGGNWAEVAPCKR